jgi:hypothetical protein
MDQDTSGHQYPDDYDEQGTLDADASRVPDVFLYPRHDQQLPPPQRRQMGLDRGIQCMGLRLEMSVFPAPLVRIFTFFLYTLLNDFLTSLRCTNERPHTWPCIYEVKVCEKYHAKRRASEEAEV